MRPTLTMADHERFERDGFVLIRGLVPLDTVKAALARLHDADARGACAPPVLSAVQELCGAVGVVLSEGPTDVPRPHTPGIGPTGFIGHADLPNPLLLPDAFAVSAFVFLTQVISGGGALMVAPGSHRRYRAFVDDVDSEALWGAMSRPELVGDLQEVLAEPGDVILMHHMLGHAGSANRTDPRTRHALNMRFKTASPLIPRGLPEAEMSTVQRMSSPSAIGARRVTPADPDFPAHPIGSHATARLGGRTHVLWHDEAGVHHAHTTDLRHWDDLGALSITADGPLHLELRFGPVLVSGRSVWESTDLHTWREIHRAEHQLGRPYFVHDGQGAQRATGRMLVTIEGNAVRWACRPAGAAWDDVADAGQLHVHNAPVTDAAVRAVAGVWHHVLIAEDATGQTLWSLSHEADRFEEPLTPIRSDVPVSQLRVWERGPFQWIVTYVSDGRLRWGRVTWGDPATRGTLEDLPTAVSLRRALAEIGLR